VSDGGRLTGRCNRNALPSAGLPLKSPSCCMVWRENGLARGMVRYTISRIGGVLTFGASSSGPPGDGPVPVASGRAGPVVPALRRPCRPWPDMFPPAARRVRFLPAWPAPCPPGFAPAPWGC